MWAAAQARLAEFSTLLRHCSLALSLVRPVLISADHSLPLAGDRLPIVDLRQRQSWRRQLPGRLGTGVLWLGSLCLVGPLKLGVLALAGGVVSSGLLWLDRCARRAPAPPAPAPTGIAPVPVPLVTREALAVQLGLAESQLFRARHAPRCTVIHDGNGRIVGLALPVAPQPLLPSRTDAHPVG